MCLLYQNEEPIESKGNRQKSALILNNDNISTKFKLSDLNRSDIERIKYRYDN